MKGVSRMATLHALDISKRDISSDEVFAVLLALCIGIYMAWSLINAYAHWKVNKARPTIEKNAKAQERERAQKEEAVHLREYNHALTLELQNVLNERSQRYPWMAEQFSDFIFMFDMLTADELIRKSHPAKTSSEKVRAIAREKRELTKEVKMLRYQLGFYESIFPWLEDFKEVDVQDAIEYAKNASDTDNEENEWEYYRNYLSPEEFDKLSRNEKDQLMLDRFLNKSKKTNWEAGIEYERYIGHLFEQNGCTVIYSGAIMGVEDIGRDLIVFDTDGDVTIVQCKRWSKDKSIHEKHIFQLYGSTVAYKIENSMDNVKCVFATTAPLSDFAKKCADRMNVAVLFEPMCKYPVIKCHITKNGERIFHLPYDQQYDKIKNKQDGDVLYVKTIDEATSAGFRHAFRWSGNKS